MAVTRRRSRWAAAGRLLAGRPVRWGFVAVTVGLGGYAVAREWPGVRTSLASIGVGTAAEALLCVLAAMVLTMQVWRVLLAGLGSPLPARGASRIMFIGQLGKYLPGSVWPVLAQMELGSAYRVPRHRSATASVLAMVVSLLTGLLMALATLPFVAGAPAYLWAFAITPVLLACLHPRVLNAVVGRLLRLARRPPLEQPLTGRAMAAALAWSWPPGCSTGCRYGCSRPGWGPRRAGPCCSLSAVSPSPGAWASWSCWPRPGRGYGTSS